MKHLTDAQQLCEEGRTQDAWAVLENLLALAPKNPEALLLKASILEGWGRFDEAESLLLSLAKNSKDERIQEEWERHLDEQAEEAHYSQATPQGRWYFPFDPLKILVACFGLMGSVLFLSLGLSSHEEAGFSVLMQGAFVFLVLLPALALLVMNLRGLKKIFVDGDGICVFQGLKKIQCPWSQIECVVIESNPMAHQLQLILYERHNHDVLVRLDISEESGKLPARKHLVRLVASYVGVVSYKNS